jgi:hypothetical protein
MKAGKYRQVIRLKDKLTLIEVESTGTIEGPQPAVELKSDL